MALGHARTDYSHYPGVLNEVNPSCSVVLRRMQYYSSLLRGTGSRLVMLWARCGASSFQDWVSKSPLQARAFRRVLLCAAAWLYRRCFLPLQKQPWQLFGLGDDRRGADHDAIALAFLATKPCCKTVGLARDLQEGGITLAELQTAEFARFMFASASSSCLSIAAVERQHALDRRIAHPRSPWHASRR